MKTTILLVLLSFSLVCRAQSGKVDTLKPKADTVYGVVVFTGHSNFLHIGKGNFHTYTLEATQVKTDTGIIYIHTELGYIDLKRNYQFYPMNKLQQGKLKTKP